MEGMERKAIQDLLFLSVQSISLTRSVVSLAWIRDGVTDTESSALENLKFIAHDSRNAASLLVSLNWIQDDIDPVEAEAIDWLANFTAESTRALELLVSLTWLQDGVTEMESEVVQNLSYVAYDSPEAALSIISFEWIQDNIDPVEAEAVDWLANFTVESTRALELLVSLTWLQDGVTEMESEVVQNLSYVAYDSPEAALSIISFEWIQDNIDPVEAEAVDWLANFTVESTRALELLVSLTWLQDGVNSTEVEAIQHLSYLAFRNASAANRTITMPFLQSIEPSDVAALDSLRRLARDYEAVLTKALNQMEVAGGIADAHLPIVATLWGVARTNPAAIEVMLNPSLVSYEFRTIELPLAGQTTLVILRTRPGAARSMDLLEHAVRISEDFMQTPFPTNFVVLLYGDAVHGSFAGTNFGTHIAIRSKYDVDDGSHEEEFAASSIAHEVAHYYWSGNEDWVDEGGADLMASVSEAKRAGIPVKVTNNPCAYAANIHNLESLDASRGGEAFTCNYALGERLFVDLYHTLGEEQFRQVFRELYLASEVEDDTDEFTGTSVGIEHVREVFRKVGGNASDVIARWYDGSVPYDLSRLDTSPSDPRLPSINGRIDLAHIAFGPDKPALTEISSQNRNNWALLVLKISYQVSSLREDVHLEIVEFYEDGTEFRRRGVTITAEAVYIGGTYSSRHLLGLGHMAVTTSMCTTVTAK